MIKILVCLLRYMTADEANSSAGLAYEFTYRCMSTVIKNTFTYLVTYMDYKCFQ